MGASCETCIEHSGIRQDLDDQKERTNRIETKLDSCYNLLIVAILSIFGSSVLSLLGM